MIALASKRWRLPARWAPVAFGLMLSGLMSLIVSGIATVQARGLEPGLVTGWMEAWLSSWAVAFPTVLVVAPFVRRIVAQLTTD